MTSNMRKMQRRHFIRTSLLAIASAGISMRIATSAKAAQPHVDESDATAQALGYKNDATKADKVKYPAYKSGESCGNCQVYAGKSGDSWGGCPIFAGKDVNAKGWCSAYVKKV